MRISILTLFSVLFGCMLTSCLPPVQPVRPPRPVAPPAPRDETLINDEAQRQLEQARQNMGIQNPVPTTPTNNFIEPLPQANPPIALDPSMQTPPAPTPTTPATYPYATKVPSKPGFVFNPYTKNQVDVRGIPQGTLVRDPYDNDKGHKFRVP